VTHEETTVGQELRRQARAHPDRLFVQCGEASRTFAEMDRVSDRIAAGLAARGVAPGDRVAVVAPNRIEVLDLYLGVAKAGAVQVPLNVYLKGDFLSHQLVDADPAVVVADSSGLRAVQPLLGGLPNLTTVVVLDDDRAPVGRGIAYTDLVEAGSAPPEPPVAPSDLMSILYTSGTTGMPKGCMMSHAYYLHTGRAMAEAWGLTDDDVLFTALPMFHSAGRLMVLATALARGIPVVVEPEFSARRFLPRAAEVGATFACSVGAMGMALLATEPGPADRTHGLRAVMCTPMDPADQVAFESRFGVVLWAEAFGQTECLPVSCSSIGALADRSNGPVVPWLELALLGDDDRPVPPGGSGEICLRPRKPGVMFSGYWRRPDATAEATTTLWYHTGDLGRLNARGHLEFVSRKKESIRRRGENVSMLELEAALLRSPLIAEAAVAAVPSAVSEDDIVAYLVPEPGREPAPGELFSFFRESLPYFAIPRYVRVVPQLPRNAIGRVMRHELPPLDHLTWDLDDLGLTLEKGGRRA
jgi:crotonobetaine/carnitine-CoA ligase